MRHCKIGKVTRKPLVTDRLRKEYTDYLRVQNPLLQWPPMQNPWELPRVPSIASPGTGYVNPLTQWVS